MTNLTNSTLLSSSKRTIKFVALMVVLLMPAILIAQAKLYWNVASGLWADANAWSSTSGGAGNTTWNFTTDTEAVFEYAGASVVTLPLASTTDSVMTCSKMTVSDACTGITINKGATKAYVLNGDCTFDVPTGKYLKFGTVNLSIAGNTPSGSAISFTKTGGGEFMQNAGSSATTLNLEGGIFTLNAVLATLKTINIANGTTIASQKSTLSAQQLHAAALNVNGDFSLGLSAVVSVGALNGTIGFSGPVNLGTATNRIITNVGMKSAAFSGIISGEGSSLTLASTYINSITSVNDGYLTLSGANTYSGGTTITGGKVYAANASALGTGMLTLAGGNLSVMVGMDLATKALSAVGVSVNVSKLKVNDNSTIALGTGVHTLTIGNSSAEAWTSGKTLTITGWTGEAGTSGTAGKIIVGDGGLTPAQLAQINFTGYANGAMIIAGGELVPGTLSGISQVYESNKLVTVRKNAIVSNVEGLIQLMSVDGKILMNQSVNEGQIINLKSGIYMVRTKTNNGLAIQKVVL